MYKYTKKIHNNARSREKSGTTPAKRTVSFRRIVRNQPSRDMQVSRMCSKPISKIWRTWSSASA